MPVLCAASAQAVCGGHRRPWMPTSVGICECEFASVNNGRSEAWCASTLGQGCGRHPSRRGAEHVDVRLKVRTHERFRGCRIARTQRREDPFVDEDRLPQLPLADAGGVVRHLADGCDEAADERREDLVPTGLRDEDVEAGIRLEELTALTRPGHPRLQFLQAGELL